MSLCQLFKANGPSGFGYGSTAEDVTEGLSLKGKTFLVTGCNSGLGLETLRVLTLRGGQVIGTARTLEKAEVGCQVAPISTLPVACELSDAASIRACAKNIRDQGIQIDAIICNAGIMGLPKLERAYGYELQFFINHIGHFILVTELIDALTETGRVVVVSSDAHRRAPEGGIEFDNLDGSKSYAPWKNYGQSKFANILFTKELAKRFKGTGRTANALHPGVIRTNLIRHMPWTGLIENLVAPLFLKTIPQGAAGQVYLTTRPEVGHVSGGYFVDCNIAAPRPDADNEATAEKLWSVSEEIAAQTLQGRPR